MAVEQSKTKKQQNNITKPTTDNSSSNSNSNYMTQPQQHNNNINGNHTNKKKSKSKNNSNNSNNKELNHTNGYNIIETTTNNNENINKNNIQHHTDTIIDILNEENNNNHSSSYQPIQNDNNNNNHHHHHHHNHYHYNNNIHQNTQIEDHSDKIHSMDEEPYNSVSSFIASSVSDLPNESINSLAGISFGSFPDNHWDDISVTSQFTLPQEFYIVSIFSGQQYTCIPNNNNFTKIPSTIINNNTNGFIIENNNNNNYKNNSSNNVEISNIINNSSIDESKKKKKNSKQQQTHQQHQPQQSLDNNLITASLPTTTPIPIPTTITVQSKSSPNISQQIQLIQQQQHQQQIAQQLQQLTQQKEKEQLQPQQQQNSQVTTPTPTTPIANSTPSTPTSSWAHLILSKPEILDQPTSPMKSSNIDSNSVNGHHQNSQVKLKKDLEKKISWIKNFDEYIGTLSSSSSSSSTTTTNNNSSKLSTQQSPQHSNINSSLSKIQSPEPKGLINTSNTCFMNVILQTLIGCNLFLRVLKNIHEIENLSQYPTIYNLHLFYTDYISHNNQAISSRHNLVYTPSPPVNPKYFNDLIKSFNLKVSPIIPNHNNNSTTTTPQNINNNNNNTTSSSIHSNSTNKQHQSSSSSSSSSTNSYINLNSPPLGTNISKKTLLKVQYSMNNLVSSIQQDAQEFLTYLLDLIHEEFLSIVKDVESIKDPEPLSSSSSSSLQTNSKDDDKWEEVTGKKGKTAIINNQSQELPKSPISLIFSGTLRSSISRTGSKESITVEPFYCVHLDIRPEDINSLDDALKFFMKPEILEGYTCSTKKIEISASKSMSFESLPRILIFHLKRFAFETEGAQKVDKLIKYPISLSMTTANSLSLPKKYSLFSVISHHGKGLSSGHYTCDILQSDGEWTKFDDSNISEVKEQEVLSREAYLLLYQLS